MNYKNCTNKNEQTCIQNIWANEIQTIYTENIQTICIQKCIQHIHKKYTQKV